MTYNKNETFKILSASESHNSAQFNNMEISLLASGASVEVMRQHMEKGSRWTLLQETEQGELQYYFIIDGVLSWQSKRNSGVLQSGDSLVLNHATETIEITALEDASLLLFCSVPLFQRHISGLRDLESMAISIEEKDGYTAEHSVHIQSRAMEIAELLNFSPKEKFDLRIGSFLHDVGKVKIPLTILNKRGPLNHHEWEMMKLHPTFGRDMILALNQFCLHGASTIVEQHHERYDGSGYPYGLQRDEISQGAAIVAVVDSFDAMTTDRVYQKARSIDEAVSEISRNRGVLYHPQIVDAFLSLDIATKAK